MAKQVLLQMLTTSHIHNPFKSICRSLLYIFDSENNTLRAPSGRTYSLEFKETFNWHIICISKQPQFLYFISVARGINGSAYKMSHISRKRSKIQFAACIRTYRKYYSNNVRQSIDITKLYELF